MATGKNKDEQEALEGFVDVVGLAEVLDTLADVCNAKADHLRGAWQDSVTAACWDKAASRLRNTAQTEGVQTVSPPRR